MKDIRDLCIHCHEDTSFGSGKFVNRIPGDNGKEIGYACADCYAVECDVCDKKTIEWETTDDGRWLCETCIEKENA